MSDSEPSTISHEPVRRANRLAAEASPYLLQHAHNPVDWYPWGAEALARARRENRLILLSIGYSACHWCHVMERESFADETIAELMNEHFVNIKVDREERPDLDEIYMAATIAMNQGQGGWPMTVFLTPRLEPVYTGTYFPPRDMAGRPGFPSVLRALADAWKRDPARLEEGAHELTEHLRRQSSGEQVAPTNEPSGDLPIPRTTLQRVSGEYAAEYDAVCGGFGEAPKFPAATALRLLLRLHHRRDDAAALEMARRTLDAMAAGGIHDQLGGGFHRYSVDREWRVPHFEKMLYDNALLAVAYLEAWQVTRDPAHRRVAVSTLNYLRREMTSPEGGCYSATDADSEGVEGRFFVWTVEELRDLLDEESARTFAAYYDVSPAGNWEGRSILRTPRPRAAVAAGLGIDAAELERRLAVARPVLYAARCRRTAPALDDKVLMAWNGLAITAFAEAHRILRAPAYLDAATRAADFVLANLTGAAGGLLRSWRQGEARHQAVLEDHAYLAEGLLTLYEAGGERRFLDQALVIAERICERYGAEGGAFFHTPAGQSDLILRYRDGADGATPSANATAADVLIKLAAHLDRDDLRQRGIEAIAAWGDLIERAPRAFARTLLVVDWLEAENAGKRLELAFVGRSGDGGLEALARAAAGRFLPHRIQCIADPDDPAAVLDLPLLAGKTRLGDRSALHVCRGFTCQEPVVEPDDAAAVLAGYAARA